MCSSANEREKGVHVPSMLFDSTGTKNFGRFIEFLEAML